jgi:hypothetical protein
MERVIFGDPDAKGIASWDTGHDETWMIPQQEYQNKEYFRSIYRQEKSQVKVVPFIWDPMFIEFDKNILKKAGREYPEYKPKPASEKKISVMEPNLNVVKYALLPILIAEEVYRKVKNNIPFKQIWIVSGKKLLKNKYFLGMMTRLDLVNANPENPLIKFVPRYPVSTILAKESDVVLSHQWTNPLNYSYLDVMHFGYPLVHNADMIKDAGYFYDDFNISEGVKQLELALETHDDNLEQYKNKNKKVLNRYISTNPKLVDTYKKLIENLFEPGKHDLSYEYNWKTNLYK